MRFSAHESHIHSQAHIHGNTPSSLGKQKAEPRELIARMLTTIDRRGHAVFGPNNGLQTDATCHRQRHTRGCRGRVDRHDTPPSARPRQNRLEPGTYTLLMLANRSASTRGMDLTQWTHISRCATTGVRYVVVTEIPARSYAAR